MTARPCRNGAGLSPCVLRGDCSKCGYIHSVSIINAHADECLCRKDTPFDECEVPMDSKIQYVPATTRIRVHCDVLVSITIYENLFGIASRDSGYPKLQNERREVH